MPQITVVQYVDRYGNRLSLETECLRSHTLPSIAYGHKRCSQKTQKSHRRKSFATTMRLAAKYGSAARKSTAISAMTREK